MAKKKVSDTYQTKLVGDAKRVAKKLELRRLQSVNNPKSIHGIYPYRGKISAIDAMSIIHQLPPNGTLLDPFCGSGTIVYESQKWGLSTIGVDNNPLATLLAKAKTQPMDKIETLGILRRIVDKASIAQSATEMPEFAKQYFHEHTATQIMRIKQMYDEMTPYLQAAFFGAIALAARACNHYKWSSNSIGKIITPHREVNFYDILNKKARKHMDSIEHNASCDIYEHDSRDLKSILPKGSVDFVYTSPPYFDALDYTGYYARIVYSIMEEDRGRIREGLIQRYSSYEEDMREILRQIEYVTNDSALIIFVVGDKKTKLGIINGGEFFTNLNDWKPSYIVEREYTGSSSQIWDSINKTRRKEQIVVWDGLMS
ncbi:MAG: DNA adenine methylase [Candidatus Thorarchaeota archaeon]